MSAPPISRRELLLRVAVAAFVGAQLAVAVLVLRRDITHPRVLAVIVLVAVAFCVLAAGRLTTASTGSGIAETSSRTAGADSQPVSGAGPGWTSAAVPGRASAATGARPVGAERSRAFAWSSRSTAATTGADWGTAAQAARPRWRPPPVAATEAPAAPQRSGSDSVPVNVFVPVHGGAWWQATAYGGAGRPAADPPDTDLPNTDPPDTDPPDTDQVTQVVQCPRCGDFTVEVSQQQPGFAFGCGQCGHQWRWEPGSAWPAGVVRPSLGPSSAPDRGSGAS
jgi:hypothetical protein